MASYRGHLAFASILGVAYGGAGAFYLHLGWGPAILGAGLTTLGGLLPDLDSDSGVPIRELFGLAATFIPLLLLHRLRHASFTSEQTLVVLGAVYVFIRYGLRDLFQKLTVHRGMFHSVPAMFIAGAVVYLLHTGTSPLIRIYLAGAVILGFFSHLLLDEICGVNFLGMRFRAGKNAGSALKFFSPSPVATLTAYCLLLGLGYLVWDNWER